MIIALAVALTGGPKVVTMGWLVIPIVTLPSRFSGHVVKLGAAFALVLLVTVAFGVDANTVAHNPPLVIGPAATIIAVSMLLIAMYDSDVEHRSRAAEALVDGLTGMLNRKALARRVEEVSQQSLVRGQRIALILVDVDHFKRINDTAGHMVGDVVLKAVADCLQKQVRAIEATYRLGGEEFLILLPGSDLSAARAVAERLREEVERERFPHDEHVTISVGVAASCHGVAFDYKTVLNRADQALYCAKRGGRNRVSPATAEASYAAEPVAVGTARTSAARQAVL